MTAALKTKTTPVSPIDSRSPFQFMRARVRESLKSESRVHTYSEGHMLFMSEDEASWFYFLEEGWIKLFRETLDGDEAVLDVLPPGSFLGETAAFENGSHACGAEVIESAKVISFPAAALTRETQENPEFALAFLRHISRKALAKDKEIELRSVQNAAQRIGCFLLRLCKDKESGFVTVHLMWEKSLIAARLGMTPETFSRSLAKLQKDVGLKIKGPTLEIPDLGALARYTCTACSNVFPCEN